MSTALRYTVTTGDFIPEWMEDEGINAAELARRLGVTPKHVSELLSGKAPLSHSTALALEQVTGVPSRLWNMYESGYRDALAREVANQALEAQYEQAKKFPLPYLRRWGIWHRLPRNRDLAAVRALADELGIAPSIVLGRVQRETKDYAWGHGLKRKLEFQMKTSGRR